MEIRVTRTSRFDYEKHPVSAKLLVYLLKNEYKNSDIIPIKDMLYLEYMKLDISVIDGENSKKLTYTIYLNLGFKDLELKDGELKDGESDPHFLIREQENPLKIQFPFPNITEAIEYLIQLEKGEVQVL